MREGERERERDEEVRREGGRGSKKEEGKKEVYMYILYLILMWTHH